MFVPYDSGRSERVAGTPASYFGGFKLKFMKIY
jgi:hypothetical protein